MSLLGYALCGSFCTHARSLAVLKQLAAEHEVLPIVSDCVYSTDTRFGKANDLLTNLQTVCNREVIHTVADAEPLGPKISLDLLIIAPCTGNTLAKIAAGITDTPVTMAAKAQLRGDGPVLIALASNDALSANLKNIAALLERKNVYFVPMKQDDPAKKPHSMIAEFEKLPEAAASALDGKQIFPVFCG